MSDVVTAADAARAALAAADGGPAIAIVAAIEPQGAVHRIIVHADGSVTGTLPDAPVMETATRLAGAALRGAAGPLVESVVRGELVWIVYVETHRAPERLIVVGAGHIAVPLAHLGTMLGFSVTVLDDREEFATADRFDDDVAVIRADFESDPFAGVMIDEHSYIALVTRGHKWDFDCLRRILARDTKPRYIGMIGSRRRVRAAFLALLDAGTPRDLLATIRAPIGIELQAETPAEIAVAIAAEMIAVRRGAEAGSIALRERVLERFLGGD